MIKSRI